jgi:site-specific recombinase XerD
LTVSKLAELSNFSKAYISQVKNGKRPPSAKLVEALLESRHYKGSKFGQGEQAVAQFLKSRRDGLSPNTVDGFYRMYLAKAIPCLGLSPTPAKVNAYINSLSCSQAGKHAYFRAMRVFYRWLYSPRSGFNLEARANPMAWVDPPKVPKRILPSLSREEVELTIDRAKTSRDKAIISLFAESGLRLSELANVTLKDINWSNRTIRTVGKGNKEALAPFGEQSERYLRAWLSNYQPNGSNVWGVNRWQIVAILRDLRAKTGLPCNPHTFRRTFACLLRKAGVDTMTIKDLGRWESIQMVERYTRSVTFEDSLKFYKAPLG